MNLKLHSSQWVSKYNKSNNRDLIFSFKILDLLNRKRSVWIGENYQIIKTKICELEYGPFLYFQSGGTSGKPKWIQHNRTSMRNAVHGLKNYLELENISSWCCLPLNHVGGMMQVIRAIELNPGCRWWVDRGQTGSSREPCQLTAKDDCMTTNEIKG